MKWMTNLRIADGAWVRKSWLRPVPSAKVPEQIKNHRERATNSTKGFLGGNESVKFEGQLLSCHEFASP